MKRKDTWRQDTPKQQLVACNQNVLGHILNIKDMLEQIDPDLHPDVESRLYKALDSMQRSAQDVMDLHHWMKENWNGAD